MKRDLVIPKVSGVEIAAVKRDDSDDLWDMYIINRNSYALNNVIVASTGYGSDQGEEQKTSTLRHLIQTLEAHSYQIIEPIQRQVFHLTNQYWVSYYVGGEIYDKKYIFLPDTIQESNISKINGFDIQGVLHR